MTLWDTNTAYYVSGKSQVAGYDINKVIEYSRSDKAVISSMSVYEILFHFRNRAGCIRRIFSSLRNMNVSIVNHPLLQNNQVSIGSLCSIKQQDLKVLVKEAADRKAQFESVYAFSMFFVIFSSALYFSLPPEDESECVLSAVLKVWKDLRHEECFKSFKDIFKYGYSTNDCEGFIKKAFDYILFENLHTFMPIAVELANGEGKTIDEIFESIELVNARDRLLKKINRTDNVSSYAKKLTESYKRGGGTDRYMVFVSKMHGIFEKIFNRSSGFWHDSIYRYFIDISARILERGGLYLKNDILDGLILQHLYASEGDKLITFDANMIQHLSKYEATEKAYSDSLKIIESCRMN
jgi:hypothetical protein